MYADNTLTPREAARLCALGTLAAQPLRYSDLAQEVRRFTSHILGPSLDVMGTSIELLKYEGLVKPLEGSGLEDDAVLSITEDGRNELITLLTARIRAQSSDMNKLITSLKFRFLHLLPADDQMDQVDLLIEATEGEIARLESLRALESPTNEAAGTLLTDWLGHEINTLNERKTWLEDQLSQMESAQK